MNFLNSTLIRPQIQFMMHAQDDMGDSSTDDDAASQTTEDDPQVPEHQEAAAPLPPAPANPNPISSLASRERPHYELRHTIRGHTMSISAVKFSPDGTLLASSGPYCFTCLDARQFNMSDQPVVRR